MKVQQDIIAQARKDCLRELYKWAQPSVDYDRLMNEYMEKYAVDPSSVDNNFFEHYYLSQENMNYIIERFIEAYHIGKDWNDNIDLLIQYITGKPYKWNYIKDEFGLNQKQLEHVPNLQETSPEHYQEILDLINTCKQFYSRDLVKESFTVPIYLGPSPSPFKDSVIEYWRNNGYPDFNIKEFNIDEVIYSDKEEIEGYDKFDDELSYEENFINSLKLITHK